MADTSDGRPAAARPSFGVVLLGEDDWERLRAIRLEALQESPESFGSTHARESGFQEVDWRDRLLAGLSAVAEVDGVDVALVGGYLPGEAPIEAELFGLWVRPEFRGLGYGGHLVETVLLWAETIGCESVHGWVAESNEQARVLYENHGFVDTGERRPLPHTPSVIEIGLRRVLSAS